MVGVLIKKVLKIKVAFIGALLSKSYSFLRSGGLFYGRSLLNIQYDFFNRVDTFLFFKIKQFFKFFLPKHLVTNFQAFFRLTPPKIEKKIFS